MTASVMTPRKQKNTEIDQTLKCRYLAENMQKRKISEKTNRIVIRGRWTGEIGGFGKRCAPCADFSGRLIPSEWNFSFASD